MTTKTCTKCKKPYPSTNEYFYIARRTMSGLTYQCKECRRKYHAATKEQRAKYRCDNRDRIAAMHREKHKRNRERTLELQRQYYQSNRDKADIRRASRKQRKLSLPDTFTKQEWKNCLKYFNYSCAVCEKSFKDVKSNKDHWIPLSSKECTGTIAANMICLCVSCNKSKHMLMPYEWLVRHHGAQKSIKILERIEIYFNEVTDGLGNGA